MKKISWFTPQDTDATGLSWYSPGYRNAAVSLITALHSKQVGVFWNSKDFDVHINFCQPYYYQLSNQHTIGYTPWESTVIPKGWLSSMESCEEIWTTSNFVKEVFESYLKDKEVFVLHHGVSDDFSIIDREVTKTFNFLHIGGDSKRKNSQMVVDAFLELFEGKQEFRLILKYSENSNAYISSSSRTYPAEEHPQILGLSGNLDTIDLVRLYHKCHAFVYPTKGEGFGMMPFEAISTGMPTICTNLTGCADFASMSLPLSARWEEAKEHNTLYQTDTGLWASPDYNELLTLMQHVVNYYDDVKKYTIQSAKIIHDQWSWDSIADKLISRLEKNNYF
jgi:glycosyltransferase involved in cell wall biosynthesis